MLSMTLWLLTVLVPLQFVLGDAHGLNTLKYQPAKLAAIEAIWETHGRVPLNLFAIPDEKAATNRDELAIPDLGSLILTHNPNGVVHGLKDWPADERPSPVAIPFFGFRIMVGIAVLMLAMVVASLWLRWRSELFDAGLVPQVVHACLSSGLHRGDGRLGDDRSRPPAVDGLRAPAHSRFRLSLPHGAGREHLAHRLWPRVPCHVLGGLRLDGQARADSAPPTPRGEPEAIEGGRPGLPVQALPSDRRGAAAVTQPVLDFVPIWTLVLGLGVFLYVLLDGFDLGVGILYGFAPDRDARNRVMNSIAPIWDGNETWLVLGGIALLAAFPLAFAIILPAVYFPILVMLLALIFRGVAFEFRYRDAEHRTFWDHAFNYGSVIGAFAQGIVLGAFIQGFQTEGRRFAGGSFDCFTPFSLLTGLALVFGYALLGSGWLILKTEGPLQDWARALGRWALVGVLIGIAAVSLWTPFAEA